MAAAPAVLLRAWCRRRHDRPTVDTGRRIGESGWDATPGQRVAAFAHRIGERNEVVVVRGRGQRTGVADQLPPAGRGDAAGV